MARQWRDVAYTYAVARSMYKISGLLQLNLLKGAPGEKNRSRLPSCEQLRQTELYRDSCVGTDGNGGG